MNSTIKLLAKLYQIDFVAVFSCTQKNKLELKTKTDQENLFLPEDQLFLEDIILNNTIAKNGFYITHKKEYKTHTKEFPNHFSSLFIIPIFSKKEKILGYVIAFHTKEIDLCDDKKAQLELYSSSIQHMWQQQIAEFEIQQVSDVIIDSVPEAISFHELPSQKTIAINRAFEEYTGYTKEEVYGQTGLDLDLWAKESERQEYQKLIAHSGQIKNFEASFKNRKGEVFFGQASTLITKYLGKDHLLLVIRNITLLKKAKSELKESEEKFRKIFDFLPDYLSIHDYNNYDFVDINNSFMDRLGFSRDQLIGENVFDMGMWNHTEQRNEYLRLIKKHGETYNFEAEFNTPHNKKITGLISAKTIILNGKPHYLVVTRDINNIKEYQRKLQESEIRFRAIVEQSPASIIILNSKGIFIYSNPKTKELFGYSSEDLLGEEFIKFTNSPNKYSLLKKIKNHQKLDDSDYFEFQILHKNGKIRDAQMQAATFIDEQGQTKTIIQLLDITDKIDKLRIINRSRAVTFLWKNAPGFPVQHVSANVHKLLGYSADEFLRFKIEYSHIIHPDDLPIVLKEQEIHLKDKDASFINHQHYRIITKQGETKWIEDRTDIQRNSQGKVISFDGVLLDITQKKKTEKDLLSAKNRAEESDRLKSSFLANMSHEIRTPMNSIIGFSGLLEDDDIEEFEKTQFIKKIKSNSSQLLNLINDIIDISKIEADQMTMNKENIDIHIFLKNTLDLFLFEAQKREIHLQYHPPKILFIKKIKVDINRLQQIINNLLTNALKFTQPQGEITFGYTLLPKQIQFFISDTGIGIPKKEQAHIFDRFRQSQIANHQNYGGTGLGLSICKGLVENMGGKISFESKLNKGSTFYFSFPI